MTAPGHAASGAGGGGVTPLAIPTRSRRTEPRPRVGHSHSQQRPRAAGRALNKDAATSRQPPSLPALTRRGGHLTKAGAHGRGLARAVLSRPCTARDRTRACASAGRARKDDAALAAALLPCAPG